LGVVGLSKDQGRASVPSVRFERSRTYSDV